MGASRHSPRVSVILPAYESGPFLEEALESILAQSFGDWEAVLVDDASPSSATFERLSAFAERDPGRIRALRLDGNRGVAGARNAAIAASSGGELIALLDHDDAWREDYLERCVTLYDEAVARGERPGIVATNAFIATPEGPTEETLADRFGWVDRISYDDMIQRNCISARAVFTRAAFDTVGGFSPDMPGFDDYDLWLRIIEAGFTVTATREPVAYYRMHDANMSRDLLHMFEGALETHRRVLARGSVGPPQRRAVNARIRHYRALCERARLAQAIAERRPLPAARSAALAVPYGLVAFAQKPSRWAEWMRDLGSSSGQHGGRVRH